jgi:cell volume regulation protein A
MAYVLTVVFTGLVTLQNSAFGEVVQIFLGQLLLGSMAGVFFGLSSRLIINRIRLDYEGLYIVLVIAIMFFSFSATDFIGGNGFLAVYLCAIILGNKELLHKKKIIKSFDSFAWLMQIVLFLTLGLLVYPLQMIPVMGIGLLISAFLIIIARPLSVFLSLSPFRVQQRSRWFISWVGLRGAVPIVFATYPLLAGAEKAQMIFNIVFFISITSLLIQGTTLPVVARWLHLSLPEKVKQRTQADLAIEEGLKSKLTGIRIPDGSEADGKQILHLGMPPTCVISYIIRGQSFVIPTGATRLKAHDTLYILSEDEASLAKAYECLGTQPDETIQIQPLS